MPSTRQHGSSGGIPGVGELFEGKYRIERILGTGGMSVVVGAVHVQLEERVAIKVLRPELAMQEVTVERFLREARAAVKIRSEHVVRVLDVGHSATNAPYMVMEYLRGRDLANVLHDDGPLEPPVAIDYMLQVCEALAQAHAQGTVHRDLKPANLFLTTGADRTDVVKVLDFGISKVATRAGKRSITNISSVLGTPNYMSPEQIVAFSTTDGRTDIWAIGIILFELLTGQKVFEAKSLTELLHVIRNAPATRVDESALPAELRAVIARCLEKERDNRFRDVEELAFTLASLGSDEATAAAERVQRIFRSATSTPASASHLPSAPAAEAPPQYSTTAPVSASSEARSLPVEETLRLPHDEAAAAPSAFPPPSSPTPAAAPAAAPASLMPTAPSPRRSTIVLLAAFFVIALIGAGLVAAVVRRAKVAARDSPAAVVPPPAVTPPVSAEPPAPLPTSSAELAPPIPIPMTDASSQTTPSATPRVAHPPAATIRKRAPAPPHPAAAEVPSAAGPHVGPTTERQW